MTKAINKQEANLPVVSNLEQFSGQGTEHITARDTKLPILKLIGNTSPVLNPSDPKYNEEAKLGDIFNEVTGSLYRGKEGCIVVPCLYVNTFNEWADRGDSAGRPVNIHTDPSIMAQTNRADDGRDRLSNGNYVEDTGNHFVYILDKDYNPVESALLTMKSTQKKKSKLWNSMISTRKMKGKNGFFTPPSWATAYKLSTVQESNSKGSWTGWAVEFDRLLDQPADSPILEITKEFYESAVKLDLFGKVAFDSDASASKQALKKETSSEKVPF